MAGRIFRFGIFELDDSTGEVRKDGRAEPRLRDQSLQILLSLLERPQEVVTREELRERLWPSDTFVDFDHGLNSAVNQLRDSEVSEAVSVELSAGRAVGACAISDQRENRSGLGARRRCGFVVSTIRATKLAIDGKRCRKMKTPRR